MRLLIGIETNALANQMLSTGQLLELVRPDKVFAFQPKIRWLRFFFSASTITIDAILVRESLHGEPQRLLSEM